MGTIGDHPGVSPLLQLPLELRHQIYGYLLHLDNQRTACLPFPKTRPAAHATVHPHILLANRQINREATPLLYADNVFLAHPSLLTSFPRLRPWLPPLRESAVLPRLKRFQLTIRLDCDLPFDADAATAAFTGLEELTVHVVQWSFMGCADDNLRVLEKVRGVRRVVIFGSTTGFEAYIAWLREAMMSDVGGYVEDFVPSELPSWSERLHLRNNLITA